MDREAIVELYHILRHELEHPTKRSNALPAMVQLLIALRFYASGSFQGISADVYTVSKSTVSRIVHHVSNCLSRQARQFIKFPEEREDIRTTKEDFFDIAGFPNILGAVDGSLVPIKSPGIEEEYNYM